MFGFVGSSTILAGRHDANKERPAPPPPTPLSFPSPVPLPPAAPALPESAKEDLVRRLMALRQPSDVNRDLLRSLNVAINDSPASVDDLIPPTYLPPSSWLDPSNPPPPPPFDGPKSVLSNGRPVPSQSDFRLRLRELFPSNEDAFSAFSRLPLPGHTPPRLAHFRRFWEGLDNMAYYWDTSLDEYIPPSEPDTAASTASTGDNAPPAAASAEASSPDLNEPRKKAKTEAAGAASSNQSASPVRDSKTPSGHADAEQAAPAGTYKGNRIGNGAGMPEQYRIDTVRAFVEPIAWAFGVSLAAPRRPPTLAVANVRVPVRMSTVCWRTPTDRAKARAGWLEGPVFGVQCRPETSFGVATGGGGGSSSSSRSGGDPSALDLARELGGLLLLAQERSREGKVERKPGEGQWWTTVPRWGGGPGGEVGEGIGASELASAAAEEASAAATDKPAGGRVKLSSKEKKKASAVEAWKQVKPGAGLWDPRVAYEAIGKDPGAEWDEVFMLSALNHHVRLLRLRVHPSYVDHLSSSSSSSSNPPSPVLSHTRWFDLFDRDDRIELMRGLWGLLGFLMRARGEGQRNGEGDVRMVG